MQKFNLNFPYTPETRGKDLLAVKCNNLLFILVDQIGGMHIPGKEVSLLNYIQT